MTVSADAINSEKQFEDYEILCRDRNNVRLMTQTDNVFL